MPVDLLAHVEDSFLRDHGLTKDICTVISLEKQVELLRILDYNIVPGGTAANQASTLALLGNQIDFVAPYGIDQYGIMARDALENKNIVLVEPQNHCTTQIIFIFLTPDGGRTFAAYYDRDIVPTMDLIIQSSARYLSINGFAFHHTAYASDILKRFKNGSYGAKDLIFCPNDISVINECKDMCLEYYNAATHIIMNADEARTILSCDTTHDALLTLQNDGKYGAITCGQDGAYIITPDTRIHCPSTLEPNNFIDSNGAGDAFSAGYIHGHIHGYDLPKIGRIASLCAAHVLAQSGARASQDLPKLIESL